MPTYRLGPYFAVSGKTEEWGLKPNTTGHEKALPQFAAFAELDPEEFRSLVWEVSSEAYPDPLPVELWKAPPASRADVSPD